MDEYLDTYAHMQLNKKKTNNHKQQLNQQTTLQMLCIRFEREREKKKFYIKICPHLYIFSMWVTCSS